MMTMGRPMIAMSRPRAVRVSLGSTLATRTGLPQSPAGYVSLAVRSLTMGIALGATTVGPWAEAPSAMFVLLAGVLLWALPGLAVEAREPT